MKSVQPLLKAGSEAIKEGATVKDVIKFTLKFWVNAGLDVTVDLVASKLIEPKRRTFTYSAYCRAFVCPGAFKS